MSRKKILGLAMLVVVLAGLLVVPAMADSLFTEGEVVGHSKGNHRLDCYIVRPWQDEPEGQYPVIVWANGWGGNNVAGETTTDWYKSMLQDWAVDGPFIVVAANAWSAREDDVLECLQWIVDQNADSQSEYFDTVNTDKIGLAGHSQGAGAVVKAGDGEPNGFEITTVLAMNPYGPSWVSAGDQDGPVMVLTGLYDSATPESWTFPVFEAQLETSNDGIYAVHQEGDHNSLGLYDEVVALWWEYQLKGDLDARDDLFELLDDYPWDSEYSGSFAD
jgi:dienelactone hydrolase